MPKYVKLFTQFSEFVRSAGNSMRDPYERKLVNLILSQFDQIAEVGIGGGKRAALINSLIQKDGKTVSDVLPDFEDKAKPNSFPFKSLESIAIEDFRGFTKREIIHFDKNYTFVYGPNGSGKSSFCEALEYTLLGYIDEAINRRIDIDRYIRNGFTGRTSKPSLIGVGEDSATVEIHQDASLYHFCFVEKNRIEDFGRISANTPNEKRSLLSTLFGLSEFSNFVGDFTKNFENYVDIVGRAQIELNNKSSGIEVQKDNIGKAKDRLSSLDRQTKELASNSGIGLDFDEIDKFIHGTGGQAGRLAVIDKLLATQVPTEILIETKLNLDRVITDLDVEVKHIKERYDEYERNRDKVQFRSLYAAAVNLEAIFVDKCPVCETPVEKASKHPFQHARGKLKELEHIAKLETELLESEASLHSHVYSFVQALGVRRQVAAVFNTELRIPRFTPMANDNVPTGIPALIDVYQNELKQWNLDDEKNRCLDQLVIKHNEETRKLQNERNHFEEERKRLTVLSASIGQIRAKCDTEEQNIRAWEKEVIEFEKTNAPLIKKANDEKVIIEENNKFLEAYNTVRAKMARYNDELPLQNLQELNSLSCNLYNLINDGDRQFEKVARIELPRTVEDGIRIVFVDSPDRELDALHVLSEGHIRCLGLSILLAKNIQEGCPLVIFDDVVNAIDDDHRAGVRRVIFAQDYMGSKQVILTTHAEQFVKELEQHVTKSDYDTLVNKLSFHVDLQDRLIRIRSDTQQNYLFKIESACVVSEWSEALYNSRCCLESLSHKLWRKLNNMDLRTEFAVVIRMPNGVPDLMSIITAISRFLKKANIASAYKEISGIFDYFSGLETVSSVIWQYLNKGTHEEEGRPEFDPAIINEIRGKLLDLDVLIKAS